MFQGNFTYIQEAFIDQQIDNIRSTPLSKNQIQASNLDKIYLQRQDIYQCIQIDLRKDIKICKSRMRQISQIFKVPLMINSIQKKPHPFGTNPQNCYCESNDFFAQQFLACFNLLNQKQFNCQHVHILTQLLKDALIKQNYLKQQKKNNPTRKIIDFKFKTKSILIGNIQDDIFFQPSTGKYKKDETKQDIQSLQILQVQTLQLSQSKWANIFSDVAKFFGKQKK